jgi:H+/Cl- antiporter ClcA
MTAFMAGSQVITPEIWPVILVGALIGAGIGAVATDGFKGSFLNDTPKDKVNEGSNNIDQQIQNILAIGSEGQM